MSIPAEITMYVVENGMIPKWWTALIHDWFSAPPTGTLDHFLHKHGIKSLDRDTQTVTFNSEDDRILVMLKYG